MQLSAISLALTRIYGGGAWSPSSLFANSEVGAWYDPSDLSTMFQDSLGATPVTADGQPVGLILDKSKGLVLGANIAPNPGPFSTTTGFSATAAITLSTAGGLMRGTRIDASVGQTMSFGPCVTVAGRYYKLTVTVSAFTQTGGVLKGGAIAGNGSLGTSSVYITAPGNYQIIVLASDITTWGVISFAGGTAGQYIECSAVSCQELPGNHASQATAAARPLYKTDGTYHWLQFDGVDDSLSTAAIDFTATDKIGVFAGVKANTGNIDSYLCGIGANASVTGSAHVFTSLSGGGNKIYQYTKGTVVESRGNFALAYPFTKVLTALFDNAQAASVDQNKLRLNGSFSALTYDVGPTSAGNYSNYSLYIGSRSGNINFLSGNIYSLIVRGALSTTQEITDTETWVAAKTGVTL